MSASYCDANEFTGKRILVTGGTRGIGQAIVHRRRPRRTVRCSPPRGLSP